MRLREAFRALVALHPGQVIFKDVGCPDDVAVARFFPFLANPNTVYFARLLVGALLVLPFFESFGRLPTLHLMVGGAVAAHRGFRAVRLLLFNGTK